MGGEPSFQTDEVVRYPRIIDNLKRDKMTEDLVTDLYQNSPIKEGLYPEVRNMALNISYDEVRHSRQFQAMIEALEKAGAAGDLFVEADPEIDCREDVRLLHEIMRLENELMHRYLRYTILFSGHQDLSQRLFKNSIDHMRHWDKNAGVLVKLGTVMRIENAGRGAEGEGDQPDADACRLSAGRIVFPLCETLPPGGASTSSIKYERLDGSSCPAARAAISSSFSWP